MNKRILIFGGTGIDKCKFHYRKYSILIDDVVVTKYWYMTMLFLLKWLINTLFVIKMIFVKYMSSF